MPIGRGVILTVFTDVIAGLKKLSVMMQLSVINRVLVDANAGHTSELTVSHTA
jgi:hypothetical protein